MKKPRRNGRGPLPAAVNALLLRRFLLRVGSFRRLLRVLRGRLVGLRLRGRFLLLGLFLGRFLLRLLFLGQLGLFRRLGLFCGLLLLRFFQFGNALLEELLVQSEAAFSSPQSFTETVERRDRSVYFSSLRNGERENFFGAVIATQPVEQIMSLPHVDESEVQTSSWNSRNGQMC